MLALKGRFIEVPFCFFGMGIFRVWTETLWSNNSVAFPSQSYVFTGYAALDLLMCAVLLVVVLASKRLAPLYGKRWPQVVAAVGMSLASVLTFASQSAPDLAFPLGVAAVALGALGVAFIILLWSEFFGCLNPLRVGLCLSGGMVVGAAILWLFKGLAFDWLAVCTTLVPLASIGCLRRAYTFLQPDERPHSAWGSFSLPWKPVAVVALYSFAYGFCSAVFDSVLSIHSGFGVVFAGVFVYAGICIKRDGFKFSIVYLLALPLILASFLPWGDLVPGGAALSSFCGLGSYSLCLIVIMVILSNLVYRYGANALWLFGIERIVRALSVRAGIEVDAAAGVFSSGSFNIALSVLCGIAVVVATALLLSEKELYSDWGMVLKQVSEEDLDAYAERDRLDQKCAALAQAFDLTEREREVLRLLARKKKPRVISDELFVASSTVKTHTRHIYRKLGVHSKQELFELLGVDADAAQRSR